MSIERITPFAAAFKLSGEPGGCAYNKRVYLESISYMNLADVKPDIDLSTFETSELNYCLVVQVMIWRARYEHESRWGWKPSFEKCTLFFQHTDPSELVRYAAEWLEAHVDGDRTTVYHDHTVKAIKCGPIGPVKHFDDSPEE